MAEHKLKYQQVFRYFQTGTSARCQQFPFFHETKLEFEFSQTLNATESVYPLTSHGGEQEPGQCQELCGRYNDLLARGRHSWTSHLQLERLLGAGGQGQVFLSRRRGADTFTLPVAIKLFSPERFQSPEQYDHEMARSGRVAAEIARIQHGNLLVVQDFLDRERIRMMVMEWVEGYDMRKLLTPSMLGQMEERFSQRRWEYLNQVLVTRGPIQPRFKPGVAVSIVRDCLGALGALHRAGIVHADIKPANIMLRRSGQAKIIDIGAAFQTEDPPERRSCTPAYAAPEVLEGEHTSPVSDLCSLGYVLVELIAGQPIFAGIKHLPELLKAKKTLPYRLHDVVPAEISNDDLLMSFCMGLTDPDPDQRFQTAEIAELDGSVSASAFLRHLIIDDLASEYQNDIRIWIEELLELDEDGEDLDDTRSY